MLTLVTSSRATRDQLPRISYIHALDVWIAFCSCFIFLSLLEFALVSYLYQFSIEKKAEQKKKQKPIEPIDDCLTEIITLNSQKDNSVIQIQKLTIQKVHFSNF